MSINSKLEVKDTGRYGNGVFTTAPIAAGELVLLFSGPIVGPTEVPDENMAIQISEERYLLPSGGADDFVNHCCEPNCGLQQDGEQLRLIALRDITVGEQLSFDYSTSTNLADGWTMRCGCGCKTCRGTIGDFDELSPELQRYYLALDVVPSYVLSAHLARKSSTGR